MKTEMHNEISGQYCKDSQRQTESTVQSNDFFWILEWIEPEKKKIKTKKK